MCKKCFILFALSLLYMNVIQAQPICTAKIFNLKGGKIEEACYLRSENPVSDITKYTILVGGVEIYEVEFTYDKSGDSIIIKYYDKQNSNSDRLSVRLKPVDSHYLICDFKANQTQINNTNNPTILFGIDHPDKQYITLYQFFARGGSQSQITLQDVPLNVINDHNAACMRYEKYMNLQNEHEFSIRDLRRKLNEYKDSVIKNITEKENFQKLNEATLVADPALQKDFTKRMDDIFLSYFKKIHTFNEESYEGDFSFFCDGNGKIKIDATKTLYIKTGPQKNWLRDSFMVSIKPVIEKGVFNTLTDTYSYQNIKSDFANWFENKFITYSNLGEADRDSFTLIKKYINDELDPYMSRTINIPTVYHYTFKYVSSIKNVNWKYAMEKDGTVKFTDKSDKESRIEITENLKQIFKNKYGTLGNGKYNLKISTVTLNDGAFNGQDIQLIENK